MCLPRVVAASILGTRRTKESPTTCCLSGSPFFRWCVWQWRGTYRLPCQFHSSSRRLGNGATAQKPARNTRFLSPQPSFLFSNNRLDNKSAVFPGQRLKPGRHIERTSWYTPRRTTVLSASANSPRLRTQKPQSSVKIIQSLLRAIGSRFCLFLLTHHCCHSTLCHSFIRSWRLL
jgi:hypothetical protein